MSETSELSDLDRRLPEFSTYTTGRFDRGRSVVVEILWLIAQALLVKCPIPGSWQRRTILRLFGATIGPGVMIKPGVRVKFPWRLRIGHHSWLGEDVWIDNLGTVTIGSNCCLSQGVYLCTGNHDWGSPGFDLMVKPIEIDDGAWISARAAIAPDVRVGKGAILGMGSVATDDLAAWTIYQGVPARAVGVRRIPQGTEFRN